MKNSNVDRPERHQVRDPKTPEERAIPQTDQFSGQFVEQKNYALFEQKNTIPKGLNSYNLSARFDLDHTTGSKHQKPAE